MRKNLLALSIAAMVGGLSGVANAQAVVTDTTGGNRLLNVGNAAALAAAGIVKNAPLTNNIPAAANQLIASTTGIGHVLFVPYFTTQGSKATLLNLVNHDQTNGKAVKLRFRGASNSDDLFDITVYLSPGDVWSANVSANGEVSALSTSDTSCTLPNAAQIKETAGNFSVGRVNGAAAETREGYVEILNMADIPVNTAPASLYTAIKHVNGVVPCGAVMNDQANALSTSPADPANWPSTRGYSWPTGGLSANWTIVDVATKASFAGEAVALRATPTNAIDQAGAANLVFSPQTTARVDDTRSLTADPLLKTSPVTGTSVVRAASYDFPDLSTPYTAGAFVTVAGVSTPVPELQAAELAQAIRTFSVSNEYLTTPAVNFATDWIFSMPTRRYAVALNYGATGPARLVQNTTPVDPTAVLTPYQRSINVPYFNNNNTSLNKEGSRICVDAGDLKAFDREEQSRVEFVISPSEALRFCGEVSVLTFNGKPSVLDAKLTVNDITTKFTDGWMRIGTPGVRDSAGFYNGLPVMGYAASKAIGADGGNFGGTWIHRYNTQGNQPF